MGFSGPSGCEKLSLQMNVSRRETFFMIRGQIRGRIRGRMRGQIQGRIQGRIRGRIRGRIQGRLRGQIQGRIQGFVGGPASRVRPGKKFSEEKILPGEAPQ